MTWGVIPVLIDEQQDTTDLFEVAMKAAEKTGIVSNGDLVVLTGGMPLGVSGTTNIMKVDVIG